jgi:chitinase
LSTPFNTASVLAAYSAAGVLPSKLNLGMPLYGRSFTDTQGLGTSFSGIGAGSFERGVYDFKDLPLEGAQEYYDEEAGATYSYDEARREFVSYDTVAMALRKVEYIAQHKLGGAMWWEISGDRTDDSGSIVTNVSWTCVIVEMSRVLTYKGCQEDGRRKWRTHRVIAQLAAVPRLKV